MTTEDLATVAQRVTADIERLSTIEAVAREVGIAGPTLRRHLKARPDQLTLAEVYGIAAVLRSDPLDYLRPVEHVAA